MLVTLIRNDEALLLALLLRVKVCRYVCTIRLTTSAEGEVGLGRYLIYFTIILSFHTLYVHISYIPKHVSNTQFSNSYRYTYVYNICIYDH